MQNYESMAQPWQQEQAQKQAINLPANNRFFYSHFPTNWQLHYIDTGKGKTAKKTPIWLPQLSTNWVAPGVNGCRGNGKTIDDTMLKASLQNKGWSIIDPNRIDYLVSRRARTGGRFWSDRFTVFTKAGNRVFKKHDSDSYNQWLIDLVVNQIVEFPNADILRGIVQDQEKNIERKLTQQHIPEQRDKLTKLKSKRDDMISAIADIEKSGIEVYKNVRKKSA
jgi:hypothetical protein